MTTQTKVDITCDKCGLQIDPTKKYVNAGTYGRDYHIACVENMAADELITQLDLDIKVMSYNDWETAEKAPGYFRRQSLIPNSPPRY